MISYFGEIKFFIFLDVLQEQMTKDEKCMDVVYLSLAGLKQVSDGRLVFQCRGNRV